MKNPLHKRYLRELKGDAGKYAVIFIFMVLLIAVISGFLIVDNNFKHAYDEGFEKYSIEDGHLAFNIEPDEEVLDEIEDKMALKFYDLRYVEENYNDTNVRIYIDREDVNTECVLSGAMPVSETDIALDRMYADNNDIAVGDTFELRGKNYTVTGLIAVPDYSCLFENNTDMMFDAKNFGVAIMTNEGFDALSSPHLTYNYAWKYNTRPADDIEENTLSEKLIDTLEDVITDYDTKLYMAGHSTNELLDVEDYVARYNNNAINFTGEDMGSDAASFMLFGYIVIAILAFVFGITTSNTISKEAGVIGTLRATGYTRGELVRHYLFLPVIVTIVAAIIGNVLGYTALKDFYVEIYRANYSLATYEDLFNEKAFLETTVVPVILMFVINLCVISSKLKLTPLQFLRHDLSKRKKKKAVHLSRKLSFMTRFRLRILFQNIPAYLTLFVGILLGGLIVVFGTMFMPMLSDLGDMIENSAFAKYQYVLINPKETENEDAEKYCVTGLDISIPGYITDEVNVYGIVEDSKYIDADIPDGEVLISTGIAEKFKIKEGDDLVLTDHFSGDEYSFKVAGVFDYVASLSIFTNYEDYLETFNEEEDFYTGYFSNELLSDIDDDNVATIITSKDLKKMADQLILSFGSFMSLFNYVGVIIFVLLMYLLTKQIIERNQISISMTKILGFKTGEIAKLYMFSTTIVVVISLFVSIPLVDRLLRFCFDDYIYTMISGYIPYVVDSNCYVTMVILGIISYAFVSLLMMFKINRIPKSEALKNVE